MSGSMVYQKRAIQTTKIGWERSLLWDCWFGTEIKGEFEFDGHYENESKNFKGNNRIMTGLNNKKKGI